MESKFYVGQKVIANRNHSGGFYKKGCVYTVLNIKKTCCLIVIEICKDGFNGRIRCSCGELHFLNGSFYSQEGFDPIEEQEISSMTYEDAIELVSEKVNV